MIVRVVTRVDGGISIIRDVKGNGFDKEMLALEGNVVSFEDIDESEIPTDRTYRDAWKLENKKIKIDNNEKTAIDSKKSVKNNAKTKLKGLGLTDDEINALIGG